MKEILNLLPNELAKAIEYFAADRQIFELRLHAGHPPILISSKNSFQVLNLPAVTAWDIQQIVLKACNNSLYAYEKELNHGFITISGNHRIGLCGNAVYNKRGEFCSIVNWSGLNIRFAVKNSAFYVKTVEHIVMEPYMHTLIAGPPACGKTTLLRCVSIELSKQHKVAIIDEREEIASPQHGPGAFVYRQIDKATGSMLAIRSMSPEYIIFDEIADEDDKITIQRCSQAGCIVYATVHKTHKCDVKSLFDQYLWCDRVIIFHELFKTKEYTRD